MKLIEIMPDLADELERGLLAIKEEELAETVKNLSITGRCGCGDDNCGTFYTLDREVWSGKSLQQVIPIVDELYAIDVFNKKIVCIEILGRNDVIRKLDQLFSKD